MRHEDLSDWSHARLTPRRPGERIDVFFCRGSEDWVAWAQKGELFDASRAAIRSSPHARVDAVTLPAGTRAYAKRYFLRDWRDVIKHLIRPSRARRALRAGQAAARLGFAVPEPLCLLEVRRWGMLRESVLVARAVEQAPDVRAWLHRPQDGFNWTPARKRAFLRAFAREVAAWHSAGLFHGDLRLGNVLAEATPDGYRFIWLDNERTRRYRRLPLRRRVQNLVQINMERSGVSLSDRWRFWKAYSENAALSRAEQAKILRAVVRWTQARWKKRGWL